MILQDNIQLLRSKDLIFKCNDFYQNLLGYSPEKTVLKTIEKNEWGKFSEKNLMDSNSLGVYFPRNQTAVIQEGNILSLFHEYFGHGLYCEKTLEGQNLVNLENALLDEEKTFFKNKEFDAEELNDFRKNNRIFNVLEKIKNENNIKYEFFAMWTEYFLSLNFGLEDIFKKRYENLPIETKKRFDEIIDYSNQSGVLGTFYGFGLLKVTNTQRAKKIINNICKEKTNTIKMGVLFGSKKPYSDIDIYLISDEITPFSSNWIDVRVHNLKRFEEGINFFDSRVTDPIFSGEFILGDFDYFNQVKQQLINQPITKEAINYNYKKSKDYENPENIESYDKVDHPENYVKDYLATALSLNEGKKLFTHNELLSYSHSLRNKIWEGEGR